MKSEEHSAAETQIDIRQLKEKLKKKLRPDNPVLVDLLREPDTMPIARAEVLIPHYLQRLERDLEKHETGGAILLRR